MKLGVVTFLHRRSYLNTYRNEVFGLIIEIAHQSQEVLVPYAQAAGCNDLVIEKHSAATKELLESLQKYEESREALSNMLMQSMRA